MNLIRWDPLADMRYLVDRSLGENDRPISLWREGQGAAAIPMDMYQTDNDVVVKATIPGVKPEDVDITLTGDVLTIKGETKSEEEQGQAEYFHREMRYGSFIRAVSLPGNLQTDKAEANFADGVLTLTIPKAEEAKPRQIKVKAKGK
ncbi:MAG: Hsp20/alpha crystallin family protein [Dehalococcoidia bacterium]